MATIYDAIRSIALVCGLGYSAQQDRKSWLWCDAVLWGCYGFGLFVFPQTLFPGNESDMLMYLVRVFASLIIGMATIWYLCRNTRDENVIGAALWSRLMSSLILLSVLAYSYSQKSENFPQKTLYFDVLCYVLLLVTSVYQFWRGQYHAGGREQKGHVSTILRINFLILFFSGLLNLTYPSWVIPFKKLSAVESVMMRSIGALFFGQSFTAWYATSFRYDEDRSAFFLAEIFSTLLMFISLNIAYFKDGLFNPREALFMHIGCVPALIVLVGLYLIWKRNTGVQSSYDLRSKSS